MGMTFMAKDFRSSFKTYRKNVKLHVGHVFSGKEEFRHAVKEIRHDSRKLWNGFLKKAPEGESARKRAIQFTKQGRQFYNNGNYEAAEKSFRNAAVEDPTYVLALHYLGNTLYKMNRSSDAVVAWRRAYDADPESETGQEAQRRIQLVAKQENDVIKHLAERLRM